MHYRLIVYVLVCLSIHSGQLRGDERSTSRPAAGSPPKRARRFTDLNQPIDILCSFLSQTGTPLSGINVVIYVQAYCNDPTETSVGKPCTSNHTVRTDADGSLRLRGVSGVLWGIEQIKAEGYDTHPTEHNTSFRLVDTPASAPSLPTTQVFHVRRRGRPAVLLSHNGLLPRLRKRAEKSIDVLGPGRGGRPGAGFEAKSRDSNPYVDLELKVDDAPSATDFSLLLRVPDLNGGFVIFDELQSEAPLEGYSRETKVICRIGEHLEKCIYLRSRNPAVFSLIILLIRADPDALTVMYRVSTNPYGDRDFEELTGVPRSLVSRLQAQAVESLKNGKRPLKPDIRALAVQEQHLATQPGELRRRQLPAGAREGSEPSREGK